MCDFLSPLGIAELTTALNRERSLLSYFLSPLGIAELGLSSIFRYISKIKFLIPTGDRRTICPQCYEPHLNDSPFLIPTGDRRTLPPKPNSLLRASFISYPHWGSPNNICSVTYRLTFVLYFLSPLGLFSVIFGLDPNIHKNIKFKNSLIHFNLITNF